jgi:hypothetical protein
MFGRMLGSKDPSGSKLYTKGRISGSYVYMYVCVCVCSQADAVRQVQGYLHILDFSLPQSLAHCLQEKHVLSCLLGTCVPNSKVCFITNPYRYPWYESKSYGICFRVRNRLFRFVVQVKEIYLFLLPRSLMLCESCHNMSHNASHSEPENIRKAVSFSKR